MKLRRKEDCDPFYHTWLRDEPLTVEELADFRARVIKEERSDPDIVLSCDTCAARAVCTLAFSWYSTDGDCLLEK